MKIKSGFLLREIAGSWIVVPIGSRVVEFTSIMTLSESGAFLWKMLESGADEDELVPGILSEYAIDEATAKTDVKEFIASISSKGMLE